MIIVRDTLRRRRRSRFLEARLVGMIIFGILAVGIRESKIAIDKAQLLNTFSAFFAARAELTEYYALHGSWPDRLVLDKRLLPEQSGNVDIQQGAVHLDIQARPDRLTLRPATLAGDDDTTVVWLCGNRLAPRGMQTAAKNLTSLQENALYAFCRKTFH